MKKVAFFGLETWEKNYVNENLKNVNNVFLNKLTTTSVKKIKDAEAISVFIHDKVDKKILDKLPKLKLVSTRSTGFDHIDVEECKKRGIVVSNVPTYGENTVAEHTFGLILSLSRKIPDSFDKVKRGHFNQKGLRGFDLKDKKIGIVGLGNIGQHVARMAYGFEMDILGFDVKKDKDLEKKYGVKYSSMDYILKNADIITFHVPLNKHTYHLINMDNIKNVKKGSFIVNTSRGGVIETKALLYGIKNNILGGVALDVLENEVLISEESALLSPKFLQKQEKNARLLLEERILTDQDNVIVTPHNAFNSKEALKRILDTTIKNVSCLNKKCYVNRVD